MKSSIAVVDIDVRIAIRELDDEKLVCFTVKLICIIRYHGIMIYAGFGSNL